jgi:hypothetical protein
MVTVGRFLSYSGLFDRAPAILFNGILRLADDTGFPASPNQFISK